MVKRNVPYLPLIKHSVIPVQEPRNTLKSSSIVPHRPAVSPSLLKTTSSKKFIVDVLTLLCILLCLKYDMLLQ